MQNDFVGSWGVCPWFFELGYDLIAPESLTAIMAIGSYGKLFKCAGLFGGYLTLKYGGLEFFVRPDIYVAMQAPKFDFFDEVKLVKTEEVGVVVDIGWHHKKREPVFHLEFGGRKLSRQYFQYELVRVP